MKRITFFIMLAFLILQVAVAKIDPMKYNGIAIRKFGEHHLKTAKNFEWRSIESLSANENKRGYGYFWNIDTAKYTNKNFEFFLNDLESRFPFLEYSLYSFTECRENREGDFEVTNFTYYFKLSESTILCVYGWVNDNIKAINEKDALIELYKRTDYEALFFSRDARKFYEEILNIRKEYPDFDSSMHAIIQKHFSNCIQDLEK